MPMNEYTFRLGDTGVVLNEDLTGLPFVDIDNVTGLDSAPFREASRDHEGVDGGFLDAEFEKARPVILEGNVYADPDELEAYLDSIKANFAPSRVLIPFYLKAPGVSERILFVKPQGARYEWTPERSLGCTRIQLMVFAEDPRIYASQLSTVDMEMGGSVTSGFGFPLGFPFGFGSFNEEANIVQLTNNGNRPTPIEFNIFGPVNTPTIINETQNKTLKFAIALGSSDVLTVNTYYRTVKLNGSSNRRSTLIEPNWFDLNPGITELRFQSGGPTNPDELVFDDPAVSDPFTRTVSNGLGTAPTGQTWTTSGGSTSEYSANGTQAIISQTSAAVLRHAYVTVDKDIQEEFDVTIPVVPTGAPISVWGASRMVDISNYYAPQLSVSTSGTVTLAIIKRITASLSTIALPVTVGTHSAGNTWRIVTQAIGIAFRAKAWRPGLDPEPFTWQVTTTDVSLSDGSQAGPIVRLEAGNTNTLPVNITIDNFSVFLPTKPHVTATYRAAWR